jgi:hypothetical protein
LSSPGCRDGHADSVGSTYRLASVTTARWRISHRKAGDDLLAARHVNNTYQLIKTQELESDFISPLRLVFS